jgi:hypothetical protein
VFPPIGSSRRWFDAITDTEPRFVVRNILRTKPASNCKFSGDHYCRECVRIPQAPPSALLPINLHVGGNRESGTFAIGLSFQAVATGNNLNLPVRQRAKWHCHAVCVSARGPNHHRRGSPIIARNEINGLEGSSRRRWGSFFDQPSHLRIVRTKRRPGN